MENENLKFDESGTEPICKLLNELGRVEAPNDFDFRVRARIAEGRSFVRSAPWFPASLRYAVPLVLLLLIGGYVAFDAFYTPSDIGVPPLAEVRPSIIAPIIETSPNEIGQPSNQLVAEKPDVKPPESENNVIPRESEKKIPFSYPKRNRPGGGSIDQAIREGRNFYPHGLKPSNKVLVKPRDFERDTQVSAKVVLSLIGIEADFSGSSWIIRIVKPDSMAERSGVKVGDMIEAINNQALTETTVFGNKFDGKSMRVRRDGQAVQIDLKP
jgi:hypothetical protein